MNRVDYAIVGGAVLLSGVGVWLTDSSGGRFVAVVGVLTLAATVMGLNRTIPRRPKLVVEYQNPGQGSRAVVWRPGVGTDEPTIEVIVRNIGGVIAEGVEVRFDRLGASHLFNESGNPVTSSVDVTVNPPRFVAKGRVLNPGQAWVVARLAWLYDTVPTTTGVWEASASGMPTVGGVVELEMLHEPPQER